MSPHSLCVQDTFIAHIPSILPLTTITLYPNSIDTYSIVLATLILDLDLLLAHLFISPIIISLVGDILPLHSRSFCYPNLPIPEIGLLRF